MEDKQKKNTRLLIIGAIVMIFLFLVVRIITSQVNGTTGLSKYNGPVYDSVVLPSYDTKIKQYELDQIKEQEEKYRKSDDAVFMDFKSAYTKVVPVDDKHVADGAGEYRINQGNPETQFSKQEQKTYSPVSYNHENAIGYSQATETKSQKSEKDITEPVAIEKENPFKSA